MGFKTVATLDSPRLMGQPDAPGINIIPVANRAMLVRGWTGRYLVPSFFSYIFRTYSGNVDMGVYDLNFNRVWSIGSTAMTVPNLGAAPAFRFDISARGFRTLKPGAYWLALAFDNIVARYDGVVAGQTVGSIVAFQDAAFPLPASLAPNLLTGTTIAMPALALGTA